MEYAEYTELNLNICVRVCVGEPCVYVCKPSPLDILPDPLQLS